MKNKILLAAVCAVFALATITVSAQTTPATPSQTEPSTTAPATQNPPSTTPAAQNPTENTQTAMPQDAATAANAANGLELPAGTQLQIRTNQNIDATQSDVGQTFSAEIAENVTDASGKILVPKGSAAQLTVAKVGATNAGVGSTELSLALQSINVGGRSYQVQTAPVTQSGNRGIGANKRTAIMTGGGALLGTLIGAAAGGGKGAVIGAVVGGAGGAAAQVATRGSEVKVPAETLLTFKLDQPVDLK